MPTAAVAASLLLATGAPAVAHAAETWVVAGDAGGALLLGEPQKSLFGPGGSAGLAVFRSLRPMWLLGARLRSSAFVDGQTPADVGRADPGTGGLTAGLLALRFRPLGRAGDTGRAAGPWLEIAAGGGFTGNLARPMGEAALGWGFGVGAIVVGPVLRYHQVLQTGRDLGGSDAKMLMAGLEIAWSGFIAPPAPVVMRAPVPPPAPAPKDSDGDGILDPDDACPDKPEDRDGFEDGDGCPDDDNDRDGIADASDSCRDVPEVVNGVADDDGCPDEGLITMVDDRVVLEEEVLFKTDRARVTSRGRRALAAVVNLWRQHPEWERLEIEGHADYRGPDSWNQQLSDDRADRVRKVLIELGLDSERLSSRGFGNTRPRVKGRDPDSLQRNRRVELVVTRKRPATDPPAAGAAPLAPPPVTQPPPASHPGATTVAPPPTHYDDGDVQ